jgi:hypothetical protein
MNIVFPIRLDRPVCKPGEHNAINTIAADDEFDFVDVGGHPFK